MTDASLRPGRPAAPTTGAADRLPLIDAFKALACVLIVAHHLAFYGPMSDMAHGLAPDLLDWLAEVARFAVQVFLAVGGFLAARSMAPEGLAGCTGPVQRIGKRYRRLVVPYAAALCVSMAVAALVRPWLPGHVVPGEPGLLQFVAHLLLLHDLLGIEALSAGVWYVAIDFQLFVLTVGLLWCVGHLPQRVGGKRVLVMLVAALTGVSLLFFNREPHWDATALYFFGAYGLGMLACWSARSAEPQRALTLLALLGAGALLVDYRGRIAVALVTALLLAWALQSVRARAWVPPRAVRYLGQVSYSVFLIHFPVCLLVASVVHGEWSDAPWINALGMLCAFALSLSAGALFHHMVENPGTRWRRLRSLLAFLPGSGLSRR